MSDCEQLGDCADSRLERIYGFLDGVLPPEDLQLVKEHLEKCPGCLEEHDLECVIRKVVRRTCSETAPSGLRDRILESIHVRAAVS